MTGRLDMREAAALPGEDGGRALPEGIGGGLAARPDDEPMASDG